ncbi:MAG: SDR family NAD(P)-dependent oxidoreductase [Planctomycetota bacterium]
MPPSAELPRSAPAHRVAIVGAGFSGLAVAVELARVGVEDVVLLEKAAAPGGTWRENTYPGCACDVPSHLYSLSFAPNPDWSQAYAGHAEIQRYLLQAFEVHGLAARTRFETELLRARWDPAGLVWRLETSRGPLAAQALVLATGPLHAPRVPELPGLADFQGEAFHTARWRHDLDLAGKRVGVVGTGSSAIQVIPELQGQVGSLTVFQRTAPWVLPKQDRRFGPAARLALRRVPGLRRAYRLKLDGEPERVQRAQRSPRVLRWLARAGRRHLARQVPDPELRARLTPEFVLGCKRILLSNTYYPALQAPNVRLVDRAVREATPRGLVDDAGEHHALDAVVWATGFHVHDDPIAARVLDGRGQSLAARWAGSPRAYLGTAVAGFPNLFLMVGPNLGNGHTSILTVAEAQARYLAQAVQLLEAGRVRALDVRLSEELAWDAEVQRALAGTVWNAGGCTSWYLDAQGRNSAIYPWTTVDLRRRFKTFDPRPYCMTPPLPAPRRPRRLRLEGAAVAVTGAAQGIGLATARAFVQAGARVALGDLDLAAAERAALELGANAHAFELDVTRAPSFAAFLDAAEQRLGPLDVLVNNAGVLAPGPFLEQDPEVEAATLAVNYGGVSTGMRLVLPRMLGRGHGRVVNLLSLASKLPVAGLATYAASKHAALGLTASVRRELDGSGVYVSAVLPTVVRTRLSHGIADEGVWALEPEDVAQAVLAVARSGAAERSVPRRLGLGVVLLNLLPERLDRWVRRRLRGEQALRPSQPEARLDYEAGVRAQARALDQR